MTISHVTVYSVSLFATGWIQRMKRSKVRPLNSFSEYTDSRGLPSTIDPHMFYEYRARTLSMSSSGIEKLIWRLIPYSYIRSFTIAIDPLYKYKVSPVRITSANRNRTIIRNSVLNKITLYQNNGNRHQQSITYNGCPTGAISSGQISTNSSAVVQTQMAREGFWSHDTTYRTRNPFSDFGEADWFSVSFNLPSRSYSVRRRDYQTYTVPSCPFSSRIEWWDYWNDGTFDKGAYVEQADLNIIKLREILKSQEMIQEHGLEVLRKATPTSRRFNLARSIIELKDLPRSISSLKRAAEGLLEVRSAISDGRIRDLVFSLNTNHKSVPSEYLSYHFGWKQLYKDIMSALNEPARVTNRINYLISRSGKFTKFGAVSKYTDSIQGPGCTYKVSAYDSERETSHVCNRRFTLRASLGASFTFPGADLPRFREDVFRKMLGVNISLGDLYDLTPWTWLLDWYTGLGNYLHIIEEINSDPYLIDYGFVSCLTEGTIVTTFKYTNVDTYDDKVDTSKTHIEFKKRNVHSSSIDFKSYLRVDASRVGDLVRSRSNPGSLTPYQNSILGALLWQRTK